MKALKTLALVSCLFWLAGCSWYQNDRQFVWDTEYQKVRDLYDQTGSIETVKRVLADYKWTPGQINEVEYRLRQDYWLDAEGVPRGIDRPRPVMADESAMSRMGLGAGSLGDRRHDRERDRWDRGY